MIQGRVMEFQIKRTTFSMAKYIFEQGLFELHEDVTGSRQKAVFQHWNINVCVCTRVYPKVSGLSR
jgi:hypothetical protein